MMLYTDKIYIYIYIESYRSSNVCLWNTFEKYFYRTKNVILPFEQIDAFLSQSVFYESRLRGESEGYAKGRKKRR